MARKKRRKAKRRNFVYGQAATFAGHQKSDRSLFWTEPKERNKDSIL